MCVLCVRVVLRACDLVVAFGWLLSVRRSGFGKVFCALELLMCVVM